MSKSKFFYDSLEDSQRRLNNTVVIYQDEPVYIQNVVGLSKDQQAEIFKLPWKGPKGSEKSLVPLTPVYFTIKRLPSLGYVDYKDFSHYLSRIPARQGKQGFCRTTVILSQNPDGHNPNFDGLLETQSCIDMLKNRYRPFEDRWNRIVAAKEPVKRALFKTLALEIDDMESVTIEHRGIKVAIANNPKKYGPVFRLVNKYFFLKEELEESGIRLEAA